MFQRTVEGARYSCKEKRYKDVVPLSRIWWGGMVRKIDPASVSGTKPQIASSPFLHYSLLTPSSSL